MPRGRYRIIKRYICQCTNSWQNHRCLWSPFLLKLFSLLLGAHSELWYRFRPMFKHDLLMLLFMWHCMERCLSSEHTEGDSGDDGAAGGPHEGNLFATNTPRRENNLLIIIVGINCTDRRMNAHLFLISGAISCNDVCPFKSLLWQQRFQFTKSKLLQMRTNSHDITLELWCRQSL